MTPQALLAAVAEAGGRIEANGDQLRLTAPRPLPADLVARIRAAKPVLLAALSEASDWPARHCEALVHWSALHPADEAARLAWGELECRWHWLYGECVPEWRCAGCGEPIGGLPSLDFQDGNRVHLNKLDCLIGYGERWRGAATGALVAMGLWAPPDEDEP